MSQQLLIVAIDIGNEYSGFAYKYTGEIECSWRDVWHGSPQSYPKTATHLLMSPDGYVEAWGYIAIKKLAELRSKGLAKDYVFLRDFKIKLDKGEKDKNGVYTIENGEKYYIFDLISAYIRLIKDEALKQIKSETAGFLNEKDIRWCLTIPDTWQDENKKLMRQAAIDAGLIGDSQQESKRLILVSEHEAIAIYCVESSRLSISPNPKILIINCNDSGVEISLCKYSNKFETITNMYISNTIDICFLEYLADKLTLKAIEQFQEKELLDYLKMMEEWKRTKCNFDPEKSGDVIYFPLGVRLYNILNTNYPQVLENLATEQNGDDSELYISRETMEGIFKPTLDGIVQKVKEQFQELENQSCDLMCLVGDCSTFPIVRRRIEQEFGKKVQNIVMPPRPSLANLAGAASFGSEPTPIGPRKRPNRLTYGINFTSIFEQGIDLESKRIWVEDLKQYRCIDRFYTLVRRGEGISVDHEIKIKWQTLSPNFQKINLGIYSTRETDVRYIDEPNVTKIGEVDIQLPQSSGLDPPPEIIFRFGTELKIITKDIRSGEEFKTAIRYNSGY